MTDHPELTREEEKGYERGLRDGMAEAKSSPETIRALTVALGPRAVLNAVAEHCEDVSAHTQKEPARTIMSINATLIRAAMKGTV